MNRVTVATVALASILTAFAPAARAEWNVGTDMGISYFKPEDGDGLTTIGWGGQEALLIPIFQPGLHVGFTLGSLRNELVTTTTVLVLNSSGSTLNAFQGMAAYQYNFGVEERTRYFVNAGLGINLLGGDTDTFSAPVFGAGVGTRQMMAHGHGSMRVEVRVDHQNEFQRSGSTVFPAANVFALRVGWELWN
jgi:hypothetical protein